MSSNGGIIRADRHSNFSVLSNIAIDDGRLHPAALGILVKLLRKPDNWQVIPKAIAKETGLGVDTVRKYLSQLADCGYLVYEQIRTAIGRFSGWGYRIIEAGVEHLKSSQNAGSTVHGFSVHGFSVHGKSQHIINTQLSKNLNNQELLSLPSQNLEERVEEPVFNGDPDPESTQESLVLSNPGSDLPVERSISGDGDFSAPPEPPQVELPHQTSALDFPSITAHFDRNRKEVFGEVELANLVVRLVDRYNQLKPDHWGKCTSTGSHIKRNVQTVLRRYREDAVGMESAIATLEQEWGEACLALKANKFYNSDKFDSGNINFLINPNHPNRISEQAQAWRDRPQEQKTAIATKMVRDAKQGVPDWRNPDVYLSPARVATKGLIYRKFIDRGDWNHPDCPSKEYIETYYPHLLNQSDV